jgi:hypothetical protein
VAGFDDLIADALPYLGREEITATQGTTWRWSYTVTDHAEDAVDLTSGFTGSCSLRLKGEGTDAATPTVTFPTAGQIVCTLAATASDDVEPDLYVHEVTITRTSDGAKIIAVGGGDSFFRVLPKVAL